MGFGCKDVGVNFFAVFHRLCVRERGGGREGETSVKVCVRCFSVFRSPPFQASAQTHQSSGLLRKETKTLRTVLLISAAAGVINQTSGFVEMERWGVSDL